MNDDELWADRKTHGDLCICPWCAFERVDATFQVQIFNERDPVKRDGIIQAWRAARADLSAQAWQEKLRQVTTQRR
jgi:hypothetical protein